MAARYKFPFIFFPAPTCTPGGLSSTSVESRSLSVVWGIVPAYTKEVPSLDIDCATVMVPLLWTLQEKGTELVKWMESMNLWMNWTCEVNWTWEVNGVSPVSLCWLDWLHSLATLYKWQQSMMEVLDHTVHHSLWRHCRMVSVECIIVHACTVAVLSLSVPGPVSDLTATPGVVHIDISWFPTLEPNRVINNYEVCHRIHSGVINCTNTLATQYIHVHNRVPPS